MTELVGPINIFTAFIDISEDEQISELEHYLADKGITLATTADDEEQVTRIERIIETSKAIFGNNSSPQDLESFMYTVVSLFHVIPDKDTGRLLNSLCTAILVGTTSANVKHRMKLLNLVFCQFDIKNVMSSIVFWHKLETGVKFGLGSQMDVDLSLLKKWMDGWSFTLEERQRMLNLLLQLYKPTSKRSLACLVLTELVSTHTSFSSGDIDVVRQLVVDLVVMAINDPDRYIFNELLELEAVKYFKSEKIYELLQEFVTGKYATFLQFCQNNDGYVENLGLDKSACLYKIQVLTLLSLAEDKSEIPFSLISSELQLDTDMFEQLVIDAIRYRLLNARIDHVNKKLVIINCFRRNFGINEWNLIHNQLSSWKQSISSFRSNLKFIKSQNTAQ